MSDSNFTLENNLSDIFENKFEHRTEEVNFVIDIIRKKSPISIWDLCKEINMSHSKVYYLIRDLEFAGVVFTKVKLNQNNRSVRMIYISKKMRRKND